MADPEDSPAPAESNDSVQLEGGTYELIRKRLDSHAQQLRSKLDQLNQSRREIFGAVPTTLIATERVTTRNNCIPRDMVALGQNKFLFGYNVHIGLKSETELADVFAVYRYQDKSFQSLNLDLLQNKEFLTDFRQLFKYYKNTRFAKFSIIGPHLFMVFRVGHNVTDIKTFRWLMRDGELEYAGNRSDHEFRFPPQHDFQWTRTHRDLHRSGPHPHISIENRVFVETIGGDLTIKIEDNTDTGEGIYSEPVEHKDQTLDDADVFYAMVGNLILLRIRPYQEDQFRLFIYNEKLKEVHRVDAIEDSCVHLPDDQGIIFSNGYYLQIGEYKEFPTSLSRMHFERRVNSPNGEDFLYVFYNRDSGTYLLMSYNLIEQKVESPITCHGFSIFENGELAYFKAEESPQKHHVIQIWQTPYLDHNLPPPEKKDSVLFKIGNPAIVRCMAECREVLTLLNKDESYADLYVDLGKATSDIIDTYFWLDAQESGDLRSTLQAIREAAGGAVDEFEKVVRIRKNTEQQIRSAERKTGELIDSLASTRFDHINGFVEKLAALRTLRGEIIGLKDLRYADPKRIDSLENQVIQKTEDLSRRCVEFILTPEALNPYRNKARELLSQVEQLSKVTETKQHEEAVVQASADLEMLIDIVSNLKIEDSTQATRIIEDVSSIYAPLNQARTALKKKRLELRKIEGEAQFAAQLRLLDQSVVNYLEVAETPDRCDEYLNKLMVQLEELETQFAEFDDYVVKLAEKRDEFLSAFENRKIGLVEKRNRRAQALMSAADRILKGIQHRVEQFEEIADIHGYYASDLMVDRVRGIIRELETIKESVKAGDLQSRLKTVREDAIRQLKDRKELFVDGAHVIQLGRHKFSVNTQPLELTLVPREDNMFFHLTGTNFFELIRDDAFEATRPVWSQELISENDRVYRAEYLAFQILKALERNEAKFTMDKVSELKDAERLEFVQSFMAPRYTEGYSKGIHDTDAAAILEKLVRMHRNIGLLRYHTLARACASLFWKQHSSDHPLLAAKLESFRLKNQMFEEPRTQEFYVAELRGLLHDFCETRQLFDPEIADEAAEYLFHNLTSLDHWIVSPEAAEFVSSFEKHLKTRQRQEHFAQLKSRVENDAPTAFQLIRDWLQGYLSSHDGTLNGEYVEEAAAVLLRGRFQKRHIVHTQVTAAIPEMAGSHPVIQEDGTYNLHYNRFQQKLAQFEKHSVPQFRNYHEHKSRLIHQRKEVLRLDEFKPRVLTSFVRNRLIDSVYLPLVGDNLAKQIGVAGEATRTDRMGLLLLISPPGYGKTTLMEYIANRLGIVFMKINGPAIGHQVTSLDPAEARNASAREEIEKLNLALEMGDNVMIYLDDIQHCHPEFLQKFISLCDAQRKIEGVHNGKAQTYDLRGRKVAVVMAGNPYTESGEKFKIPDMLANRADTYNLGDMVAGSEEVFKASYLENALTSNPVLNHLNSRSRKDIHAIIRMAQTGSRDGIDLEGNYSAEELNEMVAVMRKLLRIRDIILRINQEYIYSAGQVEEFRTEPAFRLQGSYRNMNRLAERVLPIMNDSELDALINDHYQNEAQTLTTGAEANLLKYKELRRILSESERQRWEEIKKAFQRNLLYHSAGDNDPVGRLVVQMSTFAEGLEAIKQVLASRLQRSEQTTPDYSRFLEAIDSQVEQIGAVLNSLCSAVEQGNVVQHELPASPAKLQPGIESTDVTRIIEPALSQFNELVGTLRSIQSLLADNFQTRHNHSVFRLIDPASKADYQVTDVTQATLEKIWALVEEDRKLKQQKEEAKNRDDK